ncbi:MAG: hypothetical protein JSV25_01965, partial [Spirochaetota bacterium]
MKEIDIDIIMKEIRNEVKKRKEGLVADSISETKAGQQPISISDWDDITNDMNSVRYFLDIGSKFIQARESNSSIRRLARIGFVKRTGKFLLNILLYMLHRVFNPQILFNKSAVSALVGVCSLVSLFVEYVLKTNNVFTI